MKSYSIDRRIEIDTGHRVPLHKSKCANIHGHRYVIEAICKSEILPDEGEQQGMVVDFGFLKEEMMTEIHVPCDHATIFSIRDPMLHDLFEIEIMKTVVDSVEAFGNCMIVRNYWKVYVIEGPPTAEVLAEHWYNRLVDRVFLRSAGLAHLSAVRVHETPNCSAIYMPSKTAIALLIEQARANLNTEIEEGVPSR
jgi:6-pyruvoyltetrahydropterin/6-carboxytetrahydropterin synthase